MNLQRIQIVCVLCLAGMISQFYRAANSVLAAPVMGDIGISPTAYGSMTAAFFVAFMFMQLPSGILFDRYGPRLTISGLLLLAVAGAIVFALGDNLLLLVLARGLLGVGCAAAVMGAFIVISAWFSARHFAVVSSFVIATGHLGNLLATAPFAYSIEAIGWRASFAVLSGITLVLAVVVFAVVRDRPEASAAESAEPPSWTELLQGLTAVLKMRDIQRIFVLALVAYPSMITILGLWGGPYLHAAFDMDSVAVGKVLLFMPVCSLVGTLCFGPLDQLFNSRKRAVLAGIVPLGLTLLLLGAYPDPPVVLVVVLLAAIAFFSSASMLIIAHGRGLLPDHMAGRGITSINTGVMGGATLFQLGTSLFLGLFTGPEGAVSVTGFRLMFLGMGTVALLAVCVYLPARDVHPKQPHREMVSA